ncbi:unnamed protein product [Microthlaspi erraticum]|uniref:Uncharacterized protein n=1 Tax=Microthlaspi erraticum TaxID=1685480 RepID=A0A6D2JTV8_9BRAS|nr:unnamed protein product [Microthlaspi erraticum]
MDLEREEKSQTLTRIRKYTNQVKFDPWCPLRAPKAELKQLQLESHLNYAHRIILEDESSSSIEHQRRLNPNLKEVVKKEIMKLLKAGVIIQYQIVHGSALYMSCQRKEGSQSSRMNMMSSFQQGQSQDTECVSTTGS